MHAPDTAVESPADAEYPDVAPDESIVDAMLAEMGLSDVTDTGAERTHVYQDASDMGLRVIDRLTASQTKLQVVSHSEYISQLPERTETVELHEFYRRWRARRVLPVEVNIVYKSADPSDVSDDGVDDVSDGQRPDESETESESDTMVSQAMGGDGE